MDEEKINYLRKIKVYSENQPDLYSKVKEKIKEEREREILELFNNYITELQKEV